MKHVVLFLLFSLSLILPNSVMAQVITVEVEIPEIQTTPYHKPYVAVWIETPKRKGVHTLAFWKEQSDWFKDLRQWWRKIGRKKSPNYDATTGATRKPGKYQLSWDGLNLNGNKLNAGEYVLHIESVREQGSREYLRQKFTFGLNQTQQYQLQGKSELGSIIISIK
jgi:hypothetical protein